ncbi:MAG TPA: pyruvate kinase [Candidatus Limnocylindrales bacterium]|nr:pyruvate kinase [Candidatus Limnocylindrales bacterium]
MNAPGEFAATRRTKLICTIGPATARRIPALAAAGMDVARINFSHGTPASHAAAARAVRRMVAAGDRPVAILTDLAGPKIRLGALAGGSIELEAGRPFILRVGGKGATPGDASSARVSYRRMAADVQVGDPIFLADGAAELRVSGADDEGVVRTEVVRGGIIRSGAGVAVPAARLSSPALTARDRADIPRAVSIGTTYVGQSFVRGARDVAALRRLLGTEGPGIVAKIETRPAVESFDAILDVADAVMIARGDLGVEMPYEEVPLIQKQLVRRALERGVPTIVATQMLESMIAAPRPTRAEASDVANAVFDGADAIMLSGETAIGAHPLDAAEAAARIAAFCEVRGAVYLVRGMSRPPGTDTGAIAYAAVTLAAAHTEIAAIACYTRTGQTARILSSLRPRVPVIAFTPDPGVGARLALINGVVPRRSVVLDESDRLGQLHRLLGESRLVGDGATVVLVSSTATPGSAPNLVGVQRVVVPDERPDGRGSPRT